MAAQAVEAKVSKLCDHCGSRFTLKRKKQRFCKDLCRSAWHKEHTEPVVIKSIRALQSGGFSIILHSPTAPTLQPGTRCRLESE